MPPPSGSAQVCGASTATSGGPAPSASPTYATDAPRSSPPPPRKSLQGRPPPILKTSRSPGFARSTGSLDALPRMTYAAPPLVVGGRGADDEVTEAVAVQVAYPRRRQR